MKLLKLFENVLKRTFCKRNIVNIILAVLVGLAIRYCINVYFVVNVFKDFLHPIFFSAL